MQEDYNHDICDILLDKVLRFIDSHKLFMIVLYTIVSLLVITYKIL